MRCEIAVRQGFISLFIFLPQEPRACEKGYFVEAMSAWASPAKDMCLPKMETDANTYKKRGTQRGAPNLVSMSLQLRTP